MADQFSMALDSKALEERLNSLKAEKQQQILASAFRKGAVVYQAAVISSAPERPELPSGTALPPGALKSDVIVQKAKSTGGPIYVGKFGKLTSHVARWVEYGHRLVRGGYSRVLKNGKTRGPGMVVGNVPAHPFFRNAFESATPEAIQQISDSLFKGVNRAYKGQMAEEWMEEQSSVEMY